MKTKAYAKINLFLNVKNKRDDGYHDLEMVNITVGLYDELELNLTDSEVVCNTSNKELNSKNNLAYKAAVYMKKRYNVKNGVDIYINKKIPVGGGLAGGSADAAATIEALNMLWNLNLSFDELLEISKNFGSDTPYCLYKGPAIVRGVGFDIEPLSLDISNYEISLYSPKVNVSTGVVFNNLINYNKYSLEEALEAFSSGNYDEFVKGLNNDLQDTVFELYPEVRKRYELLKNAYGEKGLFMSGSGSTLVRITKKK